MKMSQNTSRELTTDNGTHHAGDCPCCQFGHPSRRRFMKHFEARDADAAVAEMEQHLERLNRHYLSSVKEKDRVEAANG